MKIRRESVVNVKKASAAALTKFKDYIKPREDFVEFNVRGEKARKLAEIAEVIKYMSNYDATKSFQIPQSDFEKAYGPSSKGITYVKSYLKKFGIPYPRVVVSQEVVHIWSRIPVKETKSMV